MARFKNLAAMAIGTAALSTALAGCADNESSIFIVGVMDISTSDCVLSPNTEGPFIGMGQVDLAVRDSYVAAIVVGNQLTERGSREQIRTETARMRLEGAEVALEDVNGNTLAEFSTLGSGFVHPASGTDPSYGGFFTNLIPPGAAIPEGQYVAVIKVFGTTLGGQELESGALRFPIDACYGCLVTYPDAALSVSVGAGDPYECATSTADAVGGNSATPEEGTCYAGQDKLVSCIQCAANNEICRDPSLNPYYGG